MAAATFGLVSGGLIGGPIATALMRKYRPQRSDAPVAPAASAAAAQLDSLDEEIDTEPAGEAATAYTLLKMITIVLVAMWAGGLLSGWLQQFVTLPATSAR